MTDRCSPEPALACDCLLLAVRDVESLARGRWIRAAEQGLLRLFLALGSPGSRIARIPNVSIGPYQLRLSTVALLRSIPMRREGRWLRIDRVRARQLMAECLAESDAAGHAQAEVAKALKYGRATGIDGFAATAMVYAGELPTALLHPYRLRLRARYDIRHRACGR